jgi:hypothetical protein
MPAMCFASANLFGAVSATEDSHQDHLQRPVKSRDNPMSDRKLRLVAQNSGLATQSKNDVFGKAHHSDKPDSPASAEEQLRLIKAFGVIGDNRRRAWLVELVEHFASLESVAR